MLDTDSVFNVLAADDSDRRVASRRALALAHTRVENQLGAFLRGAVTSAEFDARLAQVREVVTAHVASACEETGHTHPEHIQASLVDHYRVDRRWQPRGAGVNMGQPQQVPPSPQVVQQPQVDPTQQMQQPQVDEYGNPIDPNAANADPYALQQEQDPYANQYGDPEQQFDDWGGYQNPRGAATENPSDQKDNSDKQVTCPECGGSKKTANGAVCQRCGGKGTVRNFGDSVLDSVSHVAGEGNTNLGEPEPKMDKRKWTPTDPGMPTEESKRWPTQHKDPLEVIPATNRSEPGHDLTEIGEKTTVREDLPAADGENAGFSTATPGGKAPHTKTFPKGDQASPVTRETV